MKPCHSQQAENILPLIQPLPVKLFSPSPGLAHPHEGDDPAREEVAPAVFLLLDENGPSISLGESTGNLPGRNLTRVCEVEHKETPRLKGSVDLSEKPPKSLLRVSAVELIVQ